MMLSKARLSREEEADLCRRAQEGDSAAEEILLAQYHGACYKFARRAYGLELDDAMQETRLGFLRAIRTFDPSKGCRLHTYAHQWMRQSVNKATDAGAEIIRIPVYLRAMAAQLRRMEQKVALTDGDGISDDDLLALLQVWHPKSGWTRRKLETVRDLPMADLSLDYLVNDSDNTILLDLLTDPAPLPEEVLLASNEPETFLAQDALAVLPERWRQIVELRNGFTAGLGPMTLREVGDLVGLTRERVRQIESLALAMCRQHLGLPARGGVEKARIKQW